jgi:hypothetical protein
VAHRFVKRHVHRFSVGRRFVKRQDHRFNMDRRHQLRRSTRNRRDKIKHPVAVVVAVGKEKARSHSH